MPDWVRAATHLATHDELSGVYNVSARTRRPTRSSARSSAGCCTGPSLLPAPAWPIRTVVGDVSSELLNSTRVEPARLLAEGFAFEHPTLNERLAAALT